MNSRCRASWRDTAGLAIDTHPAIGIKDLISNLITMGKAVDINSRQPGATQSGPTEIKREDQVPGPRNPPESGATRNHNKDVRQRFTIETL